MNFEYERKGTNIMKWNELNPGLTVQIVEGHDSGFGGRCGEIISIGTFEGYSKRIGAMIDIGEPLLMVIEPEALEEASKVLIGIRMGRV
ncbi:MULTISPECIES: hypothetical protein [Paenibacillus]|uniref:Ferrous iron transport protein A n=2 Tax=Paenibacillus TaxID=44249 RepID=A0ABX3GRD5_PAEBO|nr:hypothetical protein [Paenibacillus borealis]OMD35369.1 hypothetical protein BSK56_33040 [Paenibacillus borealis]